MSQPTPTSPWWHAHRHADRRPFLAARGRIKRALRTWFESQGFTEVEPGCLQVSPGNEAHLHAFRTEAVAPDLTRRALYLNTSPEFALKKLLAAGETRIFAFQPSFRNRERGSEGSLLHAAEFTMLEWYRAGEPYEQLWRDCALILQIAAAEAGRTLWSHRGRGMDAAIEPEELTVDAAFPRHAGVDLTGTYDAQGHDRDGLANLASRIGISVEDDHTWSDIFSLILTDRVEPMLGLGQPTILHAYPASQAALARTSPDDPRIAERFELYACGVELANGFGELTDAAEQRRRFEAEMDLKATRYGERYPLDEDFLAALATMPCAAGCALGFDRLVMLAAGAGRIDDVIWTPL